MAGPAQATTFEVVVVPGFGLDDLERAQELGAVGLLNPGAGPETSRALALNSLVRGEARNSLRGDPADGLLLRVSPTTGALGSVPGPAIYVGLPEGGRQPNDRRYPILVAAPGYEGVLTSQSTRIPGIVSIADVAPTALGREDALGSEPAADPAGELLALDARIRANNETRLAATLLVCALVLLLAVVAPAAAVPGLAAALTANVALGLAGASERWAVLVVLGLAVALGGPLLARLLRGPLALGVALAGVLLLHLVALALDGPAVALSPFGPTQNARYFGLSNLLGTFLLVPALGAAALLRRHLGWPAFGAVALVAFAVVAGNRFGADGGGAIVLAVGFAVLAVLLAGGSRRALAAAVAAGLVLALGLVALDTATGASSHVTRALEGGPRELAGDLAERVELSWRRATDGPGIALVVAGLLAAFACLVGLALGKLPPGGARAVPIALAAAIAASLVANDSPVDVLLVGSVGFAAASVGMLGARWPAFSSSPSPPSRSSS